MVTVILFSLTKKYNSTAQAPTPTPSNSATLSCKLKEPCSIMKPVLIFRLGDQTSYENIAKYNYCYIQEFRRYYFITNWTYANAHIVASCEVDVLGTYKTAIQASTQYVLRSTSSYDGDIIDTKYPITADQPYIYGTQITNPLLPAAGSDGCFVVGIVSKSGSLTGCVQYYAMGADCFAELCYYMFNLPTQWGAGGQDIADGIKKAITDPFQYVCSCIWLPYTVADFSTRGLATATYGVDVGYDTIALQSYPAYAFSGGVEIAFTNVVQLAIAKHPQESRGNYLNNSPYSRHYFSFYPFCGLVELDASKLVGKTYIYAVYTVDLRTGKGILNVCTDYNGNTYADWTPSACLFATEAQVGVDIPIAAIHTALPTSLAQFATSAAVTAASQSGGGFVETGKKLLATAATAVGNAIHASEEAISGVSEVLGVQPYTIGDVASIGEGALAMKSTVEMMGAQGTMSFNYRQPLRFWGVFYYVAPQDITHHGSPLCQMTTLSSLTGFVCCDKPAMPTPAGALAPEVMEIENFLASGCFLE